MPNFSQAVLCGHLGKDAETKFSASGKAVTRFSLAVSTGYGDRKQTSWYNVTLFGKEQIANYLLKGKAILVSGELSVREYDKRDGGKGTSVEVIGRDVVLLGAREDGGYQERPANGYAAKREEFQQATAPAAKQEQMEGFGVDEDDCPF